MKASAPVLDQRQPLSFDALYKFWQESCQQFLHWQKTKFIELEPSAEALTEHTKRLNLLVRFTTHLYTQAADPDNFNPDAIRVIAGRLKQLEDWRTVVHNPTTDEQANAVLARAFSHAS
jgi:hypothetical protein